MKNVLILIIMSFIILGCNDSKTTRTSLSDNAAGCSGDIASSSQTGPLFEIDGEKFSRDSLPAKLKEAVYQNEYESYNKNKTIFQEYALRIHLAKKKNLLKDPSNPPALVDVLDIPAPTQKEIQGLFDASKTRLPPGTKLEGEIKNQITNYLKSQKVGALFQAEIKKMEDSGIFRSLLSAPAAPELKLDLTGFPVKGNTESKISIVEVSDYTCGHCQRAHPEVMRVFKKYQDKVKFTQVNFALRPNGLSGLYIQGAYCAAKESDKLFWTYHDNAFAKASEPHDHSAGHDHATAHSPSENLEKVNEVAKKSGLNLAKFKTCLDSPAAKKYVTETANQISESGINGTPVFILNNKKLARGVAELEEAIKAQL